MAGSLDLLVPELRDAAKELVRQCAEARLQPRVTSTLRSHAEQTKLYRRYLAGQAGYPVAPPGLSAHEYGLAFDMVLGDPNDLADVGSVWRSWGGGWNPADAIHFELQGASDEAKRLANQNGYLTKAEHLGTSAASFVMPWWTILFPSEYVDELAQYNSFSEQLRAMKQIVHYLYPDVKL